MVSSLQTSWWRVEPRRSTRYYIFAGSWWWDNKCGMYIDTERRKYEPPSTSTCHFMGSENGKTTSRSHKTQPYVSYPLFRTHQATPEPSSHINGHWFPFPQLEDEGRITAGEERSQNKDIIHIIKGENKGAPLTSGLMRCALMSIVAVHRDTLTK